MSRKITLIALSVILLFCLFLRPATTRSQVPAGFGVDLTPSTQNPVPGQQLTITARSYSADINSAKLIWSVNGKTLQSGTGLTSIALTAPALGKQLNVSVTAVTVDGMTVTGALTVNSGSLDLIVESDGYLPLSFKGKFAPVYQNSVTVIAIPHVAKSTGVEYDPKTYVYTWKKNDQVLEDQSGYGKQSITLPGDIVPRPYDLTVTAAPRGSSGQAEGIITIAPQSPFISFYVDDPLYGPLFNSAVGSTLRIGSQQETDILAVPYGFNKPADGLGDLSLNWLINGLSHPELSSNEDVVLRAPDGSSGSSDVELDIRNSNQILQGATASFNATFTNNAPANSSATF